MSEISQRLSLGHGLGMLAKSREASVNGVSYGRVAVLWKESIASFKKVEIPNLQGFEILVAAGSIRGHSRKLLVLACYIPPSLTRQKGIAALDHITDTIVGLKRRFKDPYLVVVGDFNQWSIAIALADFPDIREAAVGPTRGRRSIDWLFMDMSRSITESGTLAPLETEEEGEEKRI